MDLNRFGSDVKLRSIRYVRYLFGFGVAVYLAVLAAMYIGQRSLLFVGSGGARAAAATVIADSEKVQLATSDGEKILAWYVAPQADKPVFLFLHGNGGGLHRMKWRWQRISKEGAGVLAISYRGYPGSSGSPTEAGLIKDAEAAYAWLRHRFPPERIVIHGLSLGTGVGIALATKVKARALILEAPFTAIVDVAAERYPYLPVRWLMWDTFMSRARIPGVHIPVFIAHGTSDSVVPFAHAKRLYALANEPKTFVAMPGSDHNTLVRDGLYTHIWRFLKLMQ